MLIVPIMVNKYSVEVKQRGGDGHELGREADLKGESTE